jgi:hypothetical protein
MKYGFGEKNNVLDQKNRKKSHFSYKSQNPKAEKI